MINQKLARRRSRRPPSAAACSAWPGIDRRVITAGNFLDVSQAEQRRRFGARLTDPVKHWKLSPMDVKSVRRWWDCTEAYQAMLEATDSPSAPWHVVPADDKRRARLDLIRRLRPDPL